MMMTLISRTRARSYQDQKLQPADHCCRSLAKRNSATGGSAGSSSQVMAKWIFTLP